MKINLKKLMVASLSAACLLAHNHTSAMESPQKNENNLGTSSFLGQSMHLGQSLTFSVADLITHFGQDKAEAFLSSSLRQSSLSNSSMQRVIDPEERAYNAVKSKDLPLFPPLKFSELSNLIEHYLLAKYSIILQEQMGFEQCSSSFGMDQTEYKQMMSILYENKTAFEQLTEAPYPLNICVQMLMPFEIIELIVRNGGHTYIMNPLPPQKPSLLNRCGTIVKGQLFVRLDAFYEDSKLQINSVHHWNLHGMAGDPNQHKQSTLNDLKGTLSKLISLPKYEHDIERDAQEVSKIVQNWFNIVRLLSKFEIDLWKPKQQTFDDLISHYAFIENQLQQASREEAFFSGVVKLPSGFGLIEVATKDEASKGGIEFLRKKVEEYKKPLEAKVSAYKVVKPHLSNLEKVVNWIDDVFADVSKNGRMT